MKETPNAEAFDIADGGWTELSRTWKDHTSPWQKAHDFAYLLGTVKHGTLPLSHRIGVCAQVAIHRHTADAKHV